MCVILSLQWSSPCLELIKGDKIRLYATIWADISLSCVQNVTQLIFLTVTCHTRISYSHLNPVLDVLC